MTDIIKILIRLFQITIGFFIASQVAAICFLFLSELIRTSDFAKFGDIEMTFILIVSTLSLGAHFAFIAFIPFIAAAINAEMKSIQSWLYYTIFASVLSLTDSYILERSDPETHSIAIRCASAMIGGIAYWLFAGRTAGNWRKMKD